MDFSNVLIPTILAGFFSQGFKIALLMLKDRRWLRFNDFTLTGGMPSSHMALVSALTLSIALYEGITTTFVISLILGLIVLRDATGVRLEAGKEGLLLNKIIKLEKLKLPRENYPSGHTPLEALAGVMIGILTAILAYGILA